MSSKIIKTETIQDDKLGSKTIKISFPNEIIQEILSRLPVKPLLRFRSVSKEWLSLISDDPSFPKMHFNCSLVSNDRTSFFISAYDTSTNERHFLSAPLDGGPMTHLITLHNARISKIRDDSTQAEHLNGLVLFTSRNYPFIENFAFVLNLATRKVFKVPSPFNGEYSKYFFGFIKSNSEHKILSMNSSFHNPSTVRFMIFSLSTYSWKEIHVDLEQLPHVSHMRTRIHHSVCADSVIHMMLDDMYKILAFDLATEKFSIINFPEGAIPRKLFTSFTKQGKSMRKSNFPFLIKDKELLGVVRHDLLVKTNEMHIWILQDHVNRVWVRETVKSSENWIELDGLGISGYLHMGNLVFSCRRLSRDMVNAFYLDMKTKSSKFVNFNLGYPFLHSKKVEFREVKTYVESILPLRGE